MTWIKNDDGSILKIDDAIAVDTSCCCGGGRCCNRELPAVLYLTVYEISEVDPLSGYSSHCCSDGKQIALFICEGDTSGTVPTKWASAPGGEEWCPGKSWWAEFSCGNPHGGDPTTANAILSVRIDGCSDGGGVSNFDCLDPADTGCVPGSCASQKGLDSATSTCTPFYFEFNNIPDPHDCCEDTTTVGKIRYVVSEFP